MRRQIIPSFASSVRQRTPGLRAAFTLIELMIVIAIILTLMALLTPALQAVFGRAKEAEVRTEIVALGNACDDFRGSFNHHPPSYIRLHESAASWNTDPESKRSIRRMFGTEFDFSIPRPWLGGNQAVTSSPENDPDGDGLSGITLKGAECLVFFLGGIPTQDSSGNWILNGFSKNPADPFKLGGSNRIHFFTDWKISRLGDADGDKFPEYRDQFNESRAGSPYMYASTMRTEKYEPTDLNATTMTKVYLQSETSATVWKPWKDGAYQIISPGRDGKYGTGGLFNEDTGVGARSDEWDNMTNFTSSKLER